LSFEADQTFLTHHFGQEPSEDVVELFGEQRPVPTNLRLLDRGDQGVIDLPAQPLSPAEVADLIERQAQAAREQGEDVPPINVGPVGVIPSVIARTIRGSVVGATVFDPPQLGEGEMEELERLRNQIRPACCCRRRRR